MPAKNAAKGKGRDDITFILSGKRAPRKAKGTYGL